VNGMVNQARARRRRTLPPGAYIKRTAVAPLPQTRGQLGQGEVSLYMTEYGEFAPEVSTWTFATEEAPAEVPSETPLEEFGAWMSGQQGAPAAGVILKPGDRGEQVRNLQEWLRNAGFGYSKVDGVYGTLTEEAVRQFQRSVGLPSSGVLDEVTLAALLSAVPAATSSTIATTTSVPIPAAATPIEREIRMVAQPFTPSTPAATPTAAASGTAAAQSTVVLGIPTGFWVAAGAIILALFATAAPSLAPSAGPQRRGVLRAQ